MGNEENWGSHRCIGCHRYLIVDIESDDYTLNELNYGYSEELRRANGIKDKIKGACQHCGSPKTYNLRGKLACLECGKGGVGEDKLR